MRSFVLSMAFLSLLIGSKQAHSACNFKNGFWSAEVLTTYDFEEGSDAQLDDAEELMERSMKNVGSLAKEQPDFKNPVSSITMGYLGMLGAYRITLVEIRSVLQNRHRPRGARLQ